MTMLEIDMRQEILRRKDFYDGEVPRAVSITPTLLLYRSE